MFRRPRFVIAVHDLAHASVSGSGAEIVKPLTTEPWGMVEFRLRTPQGHRMMFASQAPRADAAERTP